MTIFRWVNYFSQASQANSAFCPQWDGKLVPAKVQRRSVAEE